MQSEILIPHEFLLNLKEKFSNFMKKDNYQEFKLKINPKIDIFHKTILIENLLMYQEILWVKEICKNNISWVKEILKIKQLDYLVKPTPFLKIH